MKNTILTLLIILLLPLSAFSETYFMRSDGVGSQAASALSGTGDPDNATYSMNEATFNASFAGTPFANGDIVRMSMKGGDYETGLEIGSTGGTRTIILTNVEGEESLSNIVTTGSDVGIENTTGGNDVAWNISNINIDGSGSTGRTFNWTRQVTLTNMIIVAGASSPFAVHIATGSTGSWAITNCDISGGATVFKQSSTTLPCTISNSSFHGGSAEGIDVGAVGVVTVTGVDVYDNGGDGIIGKTSGTVTITNSNIHDNDDDGVDSNGDAIINISECRIYGNGDIAVASTGDGLTAHGDSYLNAWNNLIYDNLRGVAAVATSNGILYNNIIYNNYNVNQQPSTPDVYGSGIWIDVDLPGSFIVKNNIVSNNGAEVFYAGTGTIVSDYNILNNSRGIDKSYMFNGTGYATLALYQDASGKDDNSINSDPLLRITNNALTLLSGSPAENMAVELSGYTTRLLPISLWPDRVYTATDTTTVGAYGIIEGTRIQTN